MRFINFITSIFILAGNVFANGQSIRRAGNSGKHLPASKAQTQFSSHPNGNGLGFTPNQGQITDMEGKQCPDVLYKGDGAGTDIYLRTTGISYVRSDINDVMHEIQEEAEEKEKEGNMSTTEIEKLKYDLIQKALIKVHRLDVDFAGANINFEVQNGDQKEGYTNYYYSHCPQGITNVNSYNEVTIKNIYNNIDVKYYGGLTTGQGLKYDLIVNPGGSVDQLKLKYTGYKSLEIKNGNLRIETAMGTLEEILPKVYQLINGEVINIKAKYTLAKTRNQAKDSALVMFLVEAYNPSYPLIIDPYAWATYYGGNKYEYSTGLTVDAGGNTLVTGVTSSAPFPTGATAGNVVFQASNAGLGYDAFVVKFNPNGGRLWATCYGGSQDDWSYSVATDATENVAITGNTQSTNLPISAAAGNTVFQLTNTGGIADAFVVKFSSNGTKLWSTYYGGTNRDEGFGIAMDAGGNIAITGRTQSINFPIGATAGNMAFQTVLGSANYFDAFVVKFDPTGVRLWATYYGGNYNDMGFGIAIDLSGNIAITGNTISTNTISITGAVAPNMVFQPSYGLPALTNWDAFIVKFSPSGARLWGTYYGGNGGDEGRGIITDLSGNVIITGYTSSTNLPVGAVAPNTVFQATYGGSNDDAFVAKFSPTGARLWATYHGGNRFDWAFKCAADNNGNIYVLGEWEDMDNGSFLMNTCALQKTFAGGNGMGGDGPEDMFVTKFSPFGKRICSTFIGGSGHDDLDVSYGGIATWQNYVYVTGCSSGGFPVTAGAFQATHAADAGVYDAVVAKFCGNSCGENNTTTANFNTPDGVCSNSAAQFTSSVTSTLTCDTNSYLYKWYFPGASPSTSTQQNPAGITYSTPGTYTVSLVVDGICSRDSVYKTITINNCGCTLTSGTTITSPSCGKNNGTASANPNGGSVPYMHAWSNGQTTQTATGLAAGNYTVTVTDVNTCTATAIAILTPPLPLIGNFTKGTANCTSCGCKEWIMVTATGGTGPYTYTWPDGYTNRYKNQLCPGAYIVNIKDKNGCSMNMNLSAP